MQVVFSQKTVFSSLVATHQAFSHRLYGNFLLLPWAISPVVCTHFAIYVNGVRTITPPPYATLYVRVRPVGWT